MPVTMSAFAHPRILPLLDYIYRSDVSEKQDRKNSKHDALKRLFRYLFETCKTQ